MSYRPWRAFYDGLFIEYLKGISKVPKRTSEVTSSFTEPSKEWRAILNRYSREMEIDIKKKMQKDGFYDENMQPLKNYLEMGTEVYDKYYGPLSPYNGYTVSYLVEDEASPYSGKYFAALEKPGATPETILQGYVDATKDLWDQKVPSVRDRDW